MAGAAESGEPVTLTVWNFGYFSDGGKEVWKGWLYSMHPGIHPFQSDKIGLTLNGGVSK